MTAAWRALAITMILLLFLHLGLAMAVAKQGEQRTSDGNDACEMQVTRAPHGHLLTNTNVWSPDSRWIVYDTRSDRTGEKFDGQTIEVVDAETGEVREVYRARSGAHCGVATFSPASRQIAFILGPENPTGDWQYNAFHRQGVVVDFANPGQAIALDARDIVPPFTSGALRGGTHVHVFSGDGRWVSFTYEDHVLAMLDKDRAAPRHDGNQRNVGVSVMARPVQVDDDHPRNHNGSGFTVLVTRTVNDPRPGSDDISRAVEDAWIGRDGYARADGTRKRRALAFQGHVTTTRGETIAEVFVVDIPDDVTAVGDGPLEGTATTRPNPPQGTQQRRLTYTSERKYPGLQGPRHWLRSSPDGEHIAFLMRDDDGIVQLWTISPNGGEPRQVTRNAFDIESAFSWHPNGRSIAYIADASVFVTDVTTGVASRLTSKPGDDRREFAPCAEACVFSPNGKWIAFVRPVRMGEGVFNQIFRVASEPASETRDASAERQ